MSARQQLAALYDQASRTDDDRLYDKLEHAFDRAYDLTIEAGTPDDAPDDVWDEARARTTLLILEVDAP